MSQLRARAPRGERQDREPHEGARHEHGDRTRGGSTRDTLAVATRGTRTTRGTRREPARIAGSSRAAVPARAHEGLQVTFYRGVVALVIRPEDGFGILAVDTGQ